MASKADRFYLFLYLLQIFALFIFLKGFFPLEDNILSMDISEKNKLPHKRSNGNLVNKLVLVIIDALRTDYVDPGSGRDTKLLQELLSENKACFLRVRAAAPTVTMPRIKAITSGAIPNYLDIVMNLGTSEFRQDTFLHQAALQGLRIVFYGDDTWLKMFPMLFHRAKGFHSFFASDFWEVDKNITQGVEMELGRNDWDIMVVHYLGLDHIGHMEGPQSNYVVPKLAEMNAVITKIHDALKKEKQSMFIVTADHGMKNSGGHGGVTDAEVIVPLVSVGKACSVLPGWPGPDDHTPLQTDLASTLAAALGLSLPEGSMGKLIPALLPNFSQLDILMLLNEIQQQLARRSKRTNVSGVNWNETNELLETATRSGTPDTYYLEQITARYYSDLSKLSEDISRDRTEFNVPLMILGCLTLWTLLITCLLSGRYLPPCNALQLVLIIGTFGYTVSLVSTSFIEEEHQTWYFLWATLLVVAIRERCRRKVVVGSYVLDIKSCSLLVLWVLHRLLRKLNQTGDKWAHLSDWDDYLRSNHVLLLAIFMFSLAWMYYLFAVTYSHLPRRATYAAALMLIAAYRVSVGSFQIFTFYPQSRGSAEVTGFFGVILLLGSMAAFTGKPHASWMWGLLVALTLRPHNVILIPAQVFVSRQLDSVFVRENTFWSTLAHLWMGNLFYFYQGNSNSLASIDIAPAFIGADSYRPTYAVLMTVVHTFAAPIHAILLAPKNHNPVLLSRLLPSTVYCSLVLTLRHHLFIWSVFSPKLLLDSALTLVLFLTILVR